MDFLGHGLTIFRVMVSNVCFFRAEGAHFLKLKKFKKFLGVCYFAQSPWDAKQTFNCMRPKGWGESLVRVSSVVFLKSAFGAKIEGKQKETGGAVRKGKKRRKLNPDG